MNLFIAFALSVSVGAFASNSENAKRCAETVGELKIYSVYKNLSPQSASEFIDLYHPERISRFKMPFHLGLFARNHSEIGREYFAVILPHLPTFFALRPTVEEVIRLFDVTGAFDPGSLSKDKTAWKYTKAFLKAMAALSSDYFDTLYVYKNALAEVSLEARASKDPKIMDFKDELVLKRPTWTYNQILQELKIESVEVPAALLASEPAQASDSSEVSEPAPQVPPHRAQPPRAAPKPPSRPTAPASPRLVAPKDSAPEPPPRQAQPEPQKTQASKRNLIGTTNTGTTIYILKTLFNLWRESKK